MIAFCSTQYANPAPSKMTPYTAVGIEAKWFSPTHPVANGMSESQKSRCRFAQRIFPLTRVVACNMW